MANILSVISNALVSQKSNTIQKQIRVKPVSSNPFGNPFVNSNARYDYAKNKPIQGGYFAGYHNGKPNIVGQKLFIEA